MDFEKLVILPIMVVVSSNSRIFPSSTTLPLIKAETDPRDGIPGAYSVTRTLLYSSVPASAEPKMDLSPIWVLMDPTESVILLPLSTLLQSDPADAMPKIRHTRQRNTIER